MKKKIFLILLLMSLFTLTSCGKNEEKEELADDTVILENIKYQLNQDEEGYGIKYKIASNFRKSVLINAINYFSENINDRAYFVIRIYQYKNKTMDYAIKDSVPEYDKKEEKIINNLDYTMVHFINYNGANTNVYYHKHNKDIYAFVFTAGIDLSRLEKIFLNSIQYE